MFGWEGSPPLQFQGPVHLPLSVLLGCGLPLVVELFALAQADLHLDPGAFEVEAQGDQRVAVLLDLGEEAEDLPLVHQQAAGAAGFPVEDVALLIGAHVHAVEGHLPVLDGAEGILQVHVAHADGLHFRSRQFDARLVPVLHEVVVKGFAVFGDEFPTLLGHCGHLLSSLAARDRSVLLSSIVPRLSRPPSHLPVYSKIVHTIQFDKGGQMCYNLVTFFIGVLGFFPQQAPMIFVLEVYMANEKIPLTYKGHPLRRKDNVIYYGDMSDSHIILLQILDTKPVGDLNVATKVSVQLQLTAPDLKGRDRVVKRSEKDSLYAAIDVASVWLERALSAR